MKTTATLAMMMVFAAAGPTDGPRVKKIEGDSAYVGVRADAFVVMEAAETNLPVCEKSLGQAEKDLGQAQAHVDEPHAAAKALERQKKDLEDHITRLEHVVQRYEDYTNTLNQLAEHNKTSVVDQLGAGWEEVDGSVGLFAGYVLGTGTCVGMAYVFNQPAFGGNAP
jgi:hypothetical protein